MLEIFLIVLCYFIGSIPFSYILSRNIGGVDIRTKGSGNIGATNVLRNLGISVALASFSGDILKGFVATLIGFFAGGPFIAVLCAAAAILGHCYSVFLNFKGGKGVATSTGAILFIMPLVVVALLFVFALIVYISRYVSLGSITVAFLLPIMAIMSGAILPYIIFSFVLAIFVIYKHKDNIRRIMEGSEAKVDNKMF